MTITKRRIYTAILAAGILAPLAAIAASADLWPSTSADEPEPQMSGVPTVLRDTLANFDDLDFRVYSDEVWQDVHLSHADDIVVTWPDGRQTTGLSQHIEDMKWMFTFAPDTNISTHPIRFGTNDAEWTAVTSQLEGTFTQPLIWFDGTVFQPTGKHFSIQMVTLGHWNSDGLMDREYLMWDNMSFYAQLGILPEIASHM
jgi:hypothetical protein